MYKIRIISSRGKTNFDHETEATTYGQVKKELARVIDNISGMKCIDIDKRTLEVDEALINYDADGNSKLFFFPVKSKAGASNRKELYATIKGHIEANPESKDFFCAEKNYTNKSTDELERLVSAYSPGAIAQEPAAKKVVEEPTKKVVENVAAVVSSVANNASLEERVSALEKAVFGTPVETAISDSEARIKKEHDLEAERIKKENEARILAEKAEADEIRNSFRGLVN